MAKNGLASFLGWFSLGLGAAQLATPQRVGELTGIRDREGLMRAIGARELSAGIGILTQPYPTGWVWGRVAGDMMDIAMLAIALRAEKNERGRVIGSLAAVTGITLLDALTARTMSRQPQNGATTIARDGRADASHLVKTVTINRPVQEVFAYVSDAGNSGRFLSDGKHGAKDIEINADELSNTVSFRSSVSKNAMSGRMQISEAANGRGSIVRCDVHFHGMPHIGGRAGRVLGEIPGDIVAAMLRRVKQVLETGEILTNEGQPSGRGKGVRRVLQAVSP